MQLRRMRHLVTVSGVAALLMAGPAAALADDGLDLDRLEGSFEAEEDEDDEDAGPFDGFDDDADDDADGDTDGEGDDGFGFGDDDGSEDGTDEGSDEEGGGFEALGVGDDEENGADGEDDPSPGEQFCDEVIANFGEDAHEQCLEFAQDFEGDENGDNGDDEAGGDEDEGNPLADGMRQFCDEVILNLGEEAHEQCLEFAATFDDDGNGNGDEDETTEDEADGDDGFGDDDGDVAGDADFADESGSLAATGASMGMAGLTGLGLLGLGAGLLRRFRGTGVVA
jgi:hypothetical protein